MNSNRDEKVRNVSNLKNSDSNIVPNLYRRGFTLLEILIGISILIILATILWGGLIRFQRSLQLAGSLEDGISLLVEARTRTLSSLGEDQYGVHFQNDRVVLFKGVTYTAGNPDNVEGVLPRSVEISSVSLNGGGADVIFKRLTGTTDQYGDITYHLLADTSQTRTVSIVSTGLVKSGP